MIKGQWHRPNGVWRRKRQLGDNGPAKAPQRVLPDPPYDPNDPSVLAACNVHDLESLVNDAWSRLTLPERVNLLGFRRKMTPDPARAK